MPQTYKLISYTLTPADPKGHLFEVALVISSPSENGQTVSLPNWIPGSYLIRDFSKHIINLQAQTLQGDLLTIQPINKSTWQIEPTPHSIEITYQVYAWDLSVRGAHFDETHAFFNGTSVFLAVDDQREAPCQVTLKASELCQQADWQVATTLPVIKSDEKGFGIYQAPNYKTLIEYPVEIGNYLEIAFEAYNIPHKIVFTGKIERHKVDQTQLKQDLIAICETELKLFGKPYPIEQYLFQVMVTEKGYGGLEHLDSTALMCDRSNLPYLTDQNACTDNNPSPNRTEGYLQFLELCSHEYFHTWNVKRIQPEVYQTTDLSKPVYTNQLWWFEGITSFYDGLFLNQAGIVNHEDYLNRLAKEMTRVYRMPGRFKQSVAESSFLTWTKFYQQDENAPNAIISYYTKGSLIALGLDLTIRIETNNQKSLTDILLYLWQHYGTTRKGLKEGEIEAICSRVSGVALKSFFDDFLYGTEDLCFKRLFQPFGIDFSLRPATSSKDTGGKTEAQYFPMNLGINMKDTSGNMVEITHVWENSAAYHAGLSAGDEVIALNGYKMANTQAINDFLKTTQANEKISCHTFRRGELRTTDITLLEPVHDRVVLSLTDKADLNWFSKSDSQQA